MKVTREYLQQHPNCVFVFGDNPLRLGNGGAAELRDEPNVYGFITKKYPSSQSEAFYTVLEYKSVYDREIAKLRDEVIAHSEKTYLISKVGSNLANWFGIFEKVIEPRMKGDLADLPNVKFLW